MDLPASPDQTRALRRYWPAETIPDYLFRSASTDAEIDQKRPVWFVDAMWEVTGILWRSCSSGRSDCGVTTPLANPTLSLRDANGNVIASSDNWKDSQQAAIAATGKAPPNDNESAILGLLAPGNYTAIVAGKNGTTGVALIEFYSLP